MSRHMRLRLRLFIMIALLLFFLVTIGLVSIIFMRNISHEFSNSSYIGTKGIAFAEDISTQAALYNTYESKYTIATGDKERKEASKLMEECANILENDIWEYKNLVYSPEDIQLIEDVEGKWKAYKEKSASFDDLKEACANLVTFNQEKSNNMAEHGVESAQKSTRVIFLFIAVAILVTVVFLVIIVRSIVLWKNEK